MQSFMIVQMIEYLVKSIVDKPLQVSVVCIDKDAKKIIQVAVAAADLPRVIGAEGKIFRALRGLVSLVGASKGTIEYDLVVDVVA
jgi:predicted RNA-binding protein YlqC (UPF0109 family)